MASKTDLVSNPSGSSVEEAESLRYIARQPILDVRGRVHGYELLSRDGHTNSFHGQVDQATSTMIDNSVIFGLQDLTGGLPAFVNCPRETLTGLQVEVLPSSMAVLEIVNNGQDLPGLIEVCQALKAHGYRLALDDFTWTPAMEPLIQLADYVKIDLLVSTTEQRLESLAHLRGRPVALVAEKVETREVHERSRAEGFNLFQGYYFCQPEVIARRKVPANRLHHMRLLQELQQEPLNLHHICDLIKSDPSITYRLLRLANSPAYGIRREILSVQDALWIVGDDVFRRVATLAIASELSAGEAPEVLRLALLRARFCEQAARIGSLNATEQYLLGLFSLLPAMLGTSMQEAIAPLPLRSELRDALLGNHNTERGLLEWLEGNEEGDWQRCDRVALFNNLNQNHLHRCYKEAVWWMEQVFANQ